MAYKYRSLCILDIGYSGSLHLVAMLFFSSDFMHYFMQVNIFTLILSTSCDIQLLFLGWIDHYLQSNTLTVHLSFLQGIDVKNVLEKKLKNVKKRDKNKKMLNKKRWP